MALVGEDDPLRIPLDDIKQATNNFADENRIGGGGFGNVYKGELDHSGVKVTVAVKRLDLEKGVQGPHEFHQEIEVLRRHKHGNLVNLVGFSDDGGELTLVYEYLANQSLDKHLESPNLSWITRLSICYGTARGLRHLHNSCGKKYATIHRDIKSGNILLDTNWNAKMSDLGLSAYVNKKSLATSSSEPAGTIGYLDPNPVKEGRCYKEYDVYSFGMVLFEVVSGKLAGVTKIHGLSRLARRHCACEDNEISQVVFDRLKEQISPYCLKKFTKLACECIHEDRKKRPSMAKIVEKLKVILLCQIAYDAWKERKLHSHTLFQLIGDPRMKTRTEKEWLNLKKRLNLAHEEEEATLRSSTSPHLVEST